MRKTRPLALAPLLLRVHWLYFTGRMRLTLAYDVHVLMRLPLPADLKPRDTAHITTQLFLLVATIPCRCHATDTYATELMPTEVG